MTETHDFTALTRAFTDDTLNPAGFAHRDHVQVAWELLRTTDFLDAARAYVAGLQRLVKRAGAEGKFNMTITLAFLSLIAERLDRAPQSGFEDFMRQNPDLMDKNVLAPWYRGQDLSTDTAKRIFLMPRRNAVSA